MTAAERDELILSLKPLVNKLSHSRHALVPLHVQLDDLIAAAWVGAINAVDKFDPKKKIQLATYAEWKIAGAILDYLRSIDPVSRDERRKLKANPDLQAPRTISLHVVEEGVKMLQITDSRALLPFQRINARLSVEKLFRKTPNISARARNMVLRHSNGESMQSIAQSHGVQQTRVSQIRTDTLRKLRAAA